MSNKKKNYNGHQNTQGNPVLVVYLECVYIYFCERYFLPNYCREHNYYSVTTLSRSEESKLRERERRGTFLEYRKSGANYCNRKKVMTSEPYGVGLTQVRQCYTLNRICS